jgi:arylsulfatase A-like enzyme
MRRRLMQWKLCSNAPTLRVVSGSACALGACFILNTSCSRNSTSTPAKKHEGPNVVLISLDTTRSDHLGCYGYDKPVSPRIDEVAARGTVFNIAMCTASVTPVSHASILTGHYPYTHGLRVLHGLYDYQLPDSAITMAEVLGEVGYQTGAFISAFPAGGRFGLAQGFDTFNEDFLKNSVQQIVTEDGTVNTGLNQRGAGPTTDLALEWLNQTESPFFLWLHYFDPHDPMLLPPKEYLHKYPAPTGTTNEILRTLYDIEIQYMDEHIGRVVDYLDSAGQLDNTVIVIVSDHGEGLGDHNWWSHGILYQEQIQAALVVAAPGKPGGRQVDHLVSIIDVMPTTLDLVGLDLEQVPEMDGQSVVPMLMGDNSEPLRTVYADAVNTLTAYGDAALQSVGREDDMLFCITDGRWKYIHHLKHENKSELYDLKNDPGELKNLYAANREQVERLRRDLQARRPMPSMRQSDNMSTEDIQRLQSLGYAR